MATFYRFQNDRPRTGEHVHCFKTLEGLKRFASMMKRQDPSFRSMKYWEIEGIFIKEDNGDAIVQVLSVKEIHL